MLLPDFDEYTLELLTRVRRFLRSHFYTVPGTSARIAHISNYWG